MNTPKPAIATEALSREYGAVMALQPIDVTVPAGQRTALVGHNGSGKTTLIKMLTGSLDPSNGTAKIGGHEVNTIEARAALSYLADQPVFYDDLSLIEHLEYIARLHGRTDWQAAADELLERFGIAQRSDDLPITFSRGLKQKAAIAMAFIRPFDVLVVDEPFVGLDTSGRAELLRVFDETHAAGCTLLVATHELETVRTADRVIALREGTVSYDGGPNTDIGALVEGSDPTVS